MMISICLATRERPEAFKRMCWSAWKHAKHKQDIEFVSYHDNDDTSKYEYIGKHTEVVGRTKPLSEMIQACYPSAQGPIYMFVADDFLFETYNWDQKVKDVFEKSNDKILFVAPDNSDWKRWGFGVVGFLHKNWIETVGHFLPTILGESTDRWVNDVALALDRRVHLKNVKVHHTQIRDHIHDRKKMVCRRNRWNQRYGEFGNYREAEVQLLKAFINEQNNHILHSQ